MARSWFGGTSADQVVTKYHFGGSATLTAIAVGKRVTFWDDEDLGARHVDLLIDGTVPADSVVADSFGYLPRLQGPDGVTVMWADMGDATPRRLMVTTDGAIAAAADLANKIDVVEKGALNGVAELGPTGKIVQPVPVARLEGELPDGNLPERLLEEGPAGLKATYAPVTGSTEYPSRTARSQHAPAFGLYFPEAEGAVGDGTTNDAPAWAAALSAAAGKGAVYGERGKTYALGAQLSVPANITIADATFKMIVGATANDRALLIQNVSDVTVRDVVIDMNKAIVGNAGNNAGQQGIYVSNTSGTLGRIYISGVTIKNGHQRGIHVQAGAANGVTDIVIDRCTITDAGNSGIHIAATGNADKTTPSTSRRIRVTRCTILNPFRVGVQAQGVSDVEISGNMIDGGGVSISHGIVLSTSGNTSQVTDCIIARNHVTGFTAASQWGIVVSVDSKRFEITSNNVRACRGGITVDPENGNAVGVRVQVDGTVAGNSVTASVGSTGSHGIHARLCEHLTISGNTSRGNAGAGVMVANAFGCAVIGNTLNGNGTYGMQVSGTDAGTGGHHVGPNAAQGNTSGPSSFSATPVANTTYA